MILIKMKPITRLRKASGIYDDAGIFVPGGETEDIIQAHVYPIKEKELQFFPEGTRIDSIYKVRTQIPLQANEKIAGEGAILLQADILIIAGKKYQVISMGNWTEHQETVIAPKYYRSAVQLIEEQP